MKTEYAVYKGENCIGIGTKRELAEQFGVREETVAFWSTPTQARRNTGGNRKIAIKLDDEEDENYSSCSKQTKR